MVTKITLAIKIVHLRVLAIRLLWSPQFYKNHKFVGIVLTWESINLLALWRSTILPFCVIILTIIKLNTPFYFFSLLVVSIWSSYYPFLKIIFFIKKKNQNHYNLAQ